MSYRTREGEHQLNKDQNKDIGVVGIFRNLPQAAGFEQPSLAAYQQKEAGLEVGSKPSNSTVFAEDTSYQPGLPPVPFYHEATFFFTSLSLYVIKSTLEKLFRSHNISCEPDATEMRGIIRGDHGTCHFNVNFFWSEEKEQILVEFQRRSGCRFAFARLYDTIGEFDSLNTGRPRRSSGQETEKFSVFLEPESVGILFQMAMSEYLDVKRQGYQALSAFSPEKENCEILKSNLEESKLQELLLKGLQDSDDEVIHYASMLAANFAVAFPEVFTTSIIESLVIVLTSMATLENVDTKPLVAKTLCELSKTKSTSFSKNTARGLKLYVEVKDDNIRGPIQVTLSRLATQ